MDGTLDYSSVHTMLKKLHLPPYDNITLSTLDILKKYALWIYAFILILFMLLVRYFHLRQLNKHLDRIVQRKTRSLHRANKKLKELAYTDFLTGINNRGHFMELCQKVFEISKRNSTPMQIIALDIDYFKHINDTYGHHVGDEILKLFCSGVDSLMRQSDIFGRTGGEEFIICLQNTSREGTEIFANKILEKIRSLKYTTKDGEIISFRVSIGMSQLREHNTLDALLNEADQALYMAKNGGRDKALFFEKK